MIHTRAGMQASENLESGPCWTCTFPEKAPSSDIGQNRLVNFADARRIDFDGIESLIAELVVGELDGCGQVPVGTGLDVHIAGAGGEQAFDGRVQELLVGRSDAADID